MKTAFNITKYVSIVFAVILLSLWICLQSPWVQNRMAKTAASYLSSLLGTKVEVENASIGILNRIYLLGVQVNDVKGDTLLRIGKLKLAFSDWFFRQDTVEITYLGLQDAHIKIQRSDSVWNDAFLDTWLSGSSQGASKPLPFKVKADMVELENIMYEKRDFWRGKHHIAKLGKLYAKGRLTDLDNQLVILKYLSVKNVSFEEFKMKGLWAAKDSIAFWKGIDSLDAIAKNLPRKPIINPFRLLIDKADIEEGYLRFFNRKKRASESGVFDERDIVISNISGSLKGFQSIGDTIRAKVNLKAKERSGFTIESLSTDFTMHPQLMEFANLDLASKKSRIGSYYAMRYNHFDDMEYFIDKVFITANLQKAKVNIEDIAVFAPELKGIKQTGFLTGKAKGTVADFLVNNLDLQTGKSRLTGTYAMKGLIDIEKTIINFTTNNSQIDLADIEPWAYEVKELKNTPVPKLGLIGFRGSFSGTPYDFFVDGNFLTDVGPVAADLELKLHEPNMGYTATIKNASIDAGKLFGVPKLSQLVYVGKVSSNGFGTKNPVNITGNLPLLEYNGYGYTKMGVNSRFFNNLLTANLDIADPNLTGQIETELDFSELRQRYNARGKVDYANFNKLNFYKDTLLYSGAFDINFDGNTLDDFLGYARFYEASVISQRGRLNFDSLLLKASFLPNGSKQLSLATNEANAQLEGSFQLSKLGQSILLFLNRYYPTLIKAPEGLVPIQDFSFEVKTKEVEPFLQLIDKTISGGNFSSIYGSINTQTNQLLLSADVPEFSYGSFHVSNLEMQGNGSLNSLDVFAAANNIRINEQINFPDARFKVATLQDSTRFAITTNTSGALGDASINADLFSKKDGFQLRFSESSFMANKKKWYIEPNTGFQLRNGFLISDGLVVFQDQQKLEVKTTPSSEGNWNDVILNTNQFNLGDLLPYFVTDPLIEGVATGKMIIEDLLGTPNIQSSFEISRFYFNGDSVGTVQVGGDYKGATQQVNASIESQNPQFDFNALVNLSLNKEAYNQIEARVMVRNEKLSVLNPYLTDILTFEDGYAVGELKIAGKFANPEIVGKIKVKGASTLVDYTQCRYFFDSAFIEFGSNYIDFGNIEVSDSKGRKGRVEGRMYHRFFDSLGFDLRMRSDGMQVLNTQAKDNDLFYGQAVGKATFNLNGPLRNLQMRITGTPTDSSWIAISNEESRSTGDADYLVFRQYGLEAEKNKDTTTTNIHISLELTANPLCRVDVVLDEMTGDIISATGTGNLFIQSGTADPTIMRGRYLIENGYYNYTFQSFIRKPFILAGNGNNFIEWNGDPYEANLNILATYVAREVSLRDLITNEGSLLSLDQSARNYKGDVWVNATIKGNLSSPSIDFSIEFPPGSVMRNNISALDMLRRISEDESENLRQVTYLIVFRSFAPFRQGGGQRNQGTNLAVNTISEVVSREMEKILTGVIQDITRDKSFSVDLSTNFYNSSQLLGNVNAFTQYDRINVDFNLNKSFFNSRVLVNLGSDLDMNVRNTTATGFQFLPDVSVEFILTSNRKLRAIVFKRDNLDISGRRNRAGASLSYRKDFEKLFGKSSSKETLLFMRQDSLHINQ